MFGAESGESSAPDSFDEQEWQEILRVAAANVEAADQRFRREHTGDDVVKVIAAFRIYGPLVELSATALRRYAEAVSAGTPYDLITGDVE
ncbi:hypothetical protein [Microbacterium sp. 1.5R]|uniref:hypothetical protein n=1 Tax=Microbacterium sp. 1.5R TaxID=1916917 RepID=UPI0011A33F91|nr:hypothetical protein [Microbacterium sp. 1.5R]